MGKLVVIIGNSGSGKTTLARLLSRQGAYPAYFEQHLERPFQKKFSKDLKTYALANQLDYLLYRVEQEIRIRREDVTGIQDGGLEMDFFVFTRLFYQNAYLDQDEYDLCRRYYDSIRALLPLPDLAIYLNAPLDMLARRKNGRGRELDISKVEDLKPMQACLDDLCREVFPRIIHLDTSDNDPAYSRHLENLLQQIKNLD